ncbi:MAG TPA: DUF1559 domain-containing protein [Armatimonadota bacterium]|nr:DUF1559 domain-containing protein [Armatimonadota bacterium]
MSQPPFQHTPLPPHTPPPGGKSPVVVIMLVLGGCATVGVVGVAVLAAVLFPVFAQAREASRKARCLDNLTQLSVAVQMYTLDYDGRYPISATWEDGLMSYRNDPGLLTCPSEASATPGYAFNAALDRLHQDRVKAPKRQPVLFESILKKPSGSDRLESFTTRHWANGSKAGNVAYADGHVSAEARPPAATAGLKPGSKP